MPFDLSLGLEVLSITPPFANSIPMSSLASLDVICLSPRLKQGMSTGVDVVQRVSALVSPTVGFSLVPGIYIYKFTIFFFIFFLKADVLGDVK